MRYGELLMSFRSIFQDVRSAVDWVHIKVCYNVINFRVIDLTRNKMFHVSLRVHV